MAVSKKPKDNKTGQSRTKELAPAPKDTTSMQSDGEPCPVVGIGASAGGLEAFTDLLQHLPPDPGFAVIFVQHLDPKHASILTELLSRSTRMRVQQIRDSMAIRPNEVYVI